LDETFCYATLKLQRLVFWRHFNWDTVHQVYQLSTIIYHRLDMQTTEVA